MNAHQIAQHVLAKAAQKRISVCNLKLQKLLYYCQGYHLALNKEPIFDNEIEAWEHGPVVNPVYFQYRDFGSFPISHNFNFEDDGDLPGETASVIEFVIEKYGRTDAWSLRNRTHREAPWVDHQPIDGNRKNEVIPKEELSAFFSTELKGDFDSSLASLLDCSEIDLDDTVKLPESVQTADQFLEWARSFK